MANMTTSEVNRGAAPAASALLDRRSLQFLHESNAIEEITCFDYTQSEPGKLQGHVAAFLHSQQLAGSRRPFSAVDLCWWQQLIVLEQRQARIEVPDIAIGKFRSGFAPFNVGIGNYVPPSFARVPELMQAWMRDLRTHLLDDEVLAPPLLADLCGEMLQRFEAVHPFVDGNGRVGRLIVNYLLAYWAHPIVIFHAHERLRFFEAHRSKAEMRSFMRRLMGVSARAAER
jgi:Fic family protein